MIRYILVPSTGSRSDAPVFETALEIARTAGAHLEFLHVRVDPQRVMAAMASDYGGMGGGTVSGTGMDEIMETAQRDADLAEETAHAAFHAFCAREGLPLGGLASERSCTAEWHREIGEDATLLAQHGRAADLIVVGRPCSDGGTAADVLQDVLLQAGRPLLLVPQRPPRPVFGTIVVAWKDTPAAARAAAAATPFIERAERVVVCTVDEDEQDHGSEAYEASRDRLARALGWHNPHVTSRHLASIGRKPMDVLFDATADAGASLLVMGGYGHNRLREAVFGGFTQHVLKDCAVPVLIAH